MQKAMKFNIEEASFKGRVESIKPNWKIGYRKWKIYQQLKKSWIKTQKQLIQKELEEYPESKKHLEQQKNSGNLIKLGNLVCTEEAGAVKQKCRLWTWISAKTHVRESFDRNGIWRKEENFKGRDQERELKESFHNIPMAASMQKLERETQEYRHLRVDVEPTSTWPPMFAERGAWEPRAWSFAIKRE